MKDQSEKNYQFMFRLIVCTLMAFAVSINHAVADNSKSLEKHQKALEKLHKDEIKQLKKTYDAKSVGAIIDKSGYWYYLLTKKKQVAAVDSTGKLIVDWCDKILYRPEYPKGICTFTSYDNNNKPSGKYKLPHDYEAPAFIVWRNNHILINGTDGTVRTDVDGSSAYYLGPFVIVNMSKISFRSVYTDYIEMFSNGTNKMALIDQNGIVYVTGVNDLTFNWNGESIQFGKWDQAQERTLRGGMMICHPSNSIPCLFNYTLGDEVTGWMVKATSTGKLERYDPGKDYSYPFHDDGERLFETGKYLDCFNYYYKDSTNIKKPWANFFMGMSMFRFSKNIDDEVTKDIKAQDISDVKGGHSFADLKTGYSNCMFFMNKYMNQPDSILEYSSNAKDYYGVAKHNMSLVAQRQNSYNSHVAYLQKKQAQREAIAGAFLGALTGAVTKAVSGGSSSSSNKSTPVASKSSSSSTSTSSSSSSSKESEDSGPYTIEKHIPCSQCNGTGKMREITLHGDYMKTCTKCSGKGYTVRYESSARQ